WQQGAPSALAARLNQFFDDILASPLIDQLTEYSVPGQEISHGKRTGTTTITEPAPKPSVSDTALQHLPQQQLATSQALAAGPEPSGFYVQLVGIERHVEELEAAMRSRHESSLSPGKMDEDDRSGRQRDRAGARGDGSGRGRTARDRGERSVRRGSGRR